MAIRKTKPKATTPKKKPPTSRASRSIRTKATATAKAKPTTTAVKAAAKKPPAKTPVRAPTQPSRVPQRAIFVDVENTSSEAGLMQVIEALQIDRVASPTILTAVGNWRTVGQRLARRLAGLGAHLMHSAPATGVKDWSDLWIAVAAGCWLGTATAGDTLDIVSDDRAFDAVGDAAAARGVAFRRISYRILSGASKSVAAEPDEDEMPAPRRNRRGGRGRRRPGAEAGPFAPAEPPRMAAPPPQARRAVPAPAPADPGDAHGASHEQIIAILTRLTAGNPERWINLDVLANGLKTEGFVRPPSSPRLVTRLRHFKDLEVSSNGMVRLTGTSIDPFVSPPPSDSGDSPSAPSSTKRPRRRGGRRRRPVGERGDGGEMTAADVGEPPDFVDS